MAKLPERFYRRVGVTIWAVKTVTYGRSPKIGLSNPYLITPILLIKAF